MIHEFANPIPVITPKGEGYAIYVRDSGTFENDVWCVALRNGGQLLHFNTGQLQMCVNATFDISQPRRNLQDLMRTPNY